MRMVLIIRNTVVSYSRYRNIYHQWDALPCTRWLSLQVLDEQSHGCSRWVRLFPSFFSFFFVFLLPLWPPSRIGTWRWICFTGHDKYNDANSDRTSFDQHVIGGYKFLMRFYAPGDDIYVSSSSSSLSSLRVPRLRPRC